MTANQSGIASLNVREKWLVGVKEWGVKPKRLLESKIIKRANMSGAQGLDVLPADRKNRGGKSSVSDCHRTKMRVGN